MIPWPSSCSCKHCETILNVLKKQDKEIEFLRNQSGHLLHMLKKQEREIESQHQKMNALLLWVSRPPPPPPEPAMQQANANASPMYIFTTNIHGHRFLKCECHIVRHPATLTLPPKEKENANTSTTLIPISFRCHFWLLKILLDGSSSAVGASLFQDFVSGGCPRPKLQNVEICENIFV